MVDLVGFILTFFNERWGSTHLRLPLGGFILVDHIAAVHQEVDSSTGVSGLSALAMV